MTKQQRTDADTARRHPVDLSHPWVEFSSTGPDSSASKSELAKIIETSSTVGASISYKPGQSDDQFTERLQDDPIAANPMIGAPVMLVLRGHDPRSELPIVFVMVPSSATRNETALTFKDTADQVIVPTEKRILARARTILDGIVSTANLANDEGCDNFVSEIERQLDIFGDLSIQAIRELILGQTPSALLAWLCIEVLGRSRHAETTDLRHGVLVETLEAADAGLRDAAAAALGTMGDSAAREALQARLAREKNRSVRAMIKAQLA